jgi:Mg2+ and Co2+ transporter CorA
VLASVGTKRTNLSPLTDFIINFADRQTLKILEDSVIDLQVVLSTMSKTISRLRDHCSKSFTRLSLMQEEADQLDLILDELDEYVRETEMYVERGEALKEKADSTAQLVSCALRNKTCHSFKTNC